MKDIDKRECYLEEEKEERLLTLDSRQELLKEYKKWTTELWMKVIQRAIEDAALAKGMRDYDETISDEMLEWEDSALKFLFNSDHRIPFDDYAVTVKCPKCTCEWDRAMSVASEEPSVCPDCSYVISTKYIEYRIIEEKITKSISLEELIMVWGIENINEFRDGCWERISELSQRKKPAKVKEVVVVDEVDDLAEALKKIEEYVDTNNLENIREARTLLTKFIIREEE